jgi:small subunit ribosomal protein S16
MRERENPMPLKIRLRRVGRKKAPDYRIVTAESSMLRDGRFVATIGHYTPTPQPETLPIARDNAVARMAPVSESQRRRTAMRTDFVRRAFASDAAMARALNVDRSRIGRWRKGESTDATVVERLVAVDATIELLTGFLDDRSIPKWLSGTNAHLGDRRPIDVLTQGRLSEVIAAIEAEKSGAYA